jgi:hypothetical protein
VDEYDIVMGFNSDKSVYLRIESNEDSCLYDENIAIDYTFENKKTLLKMINYVKKKLEGKKSARKTNEI